MATLMQFGSGADAVLVDVSPPGRGVQAAGATETVIKVAEASFDQALRIAGVAARSFRAVMAECAVEEAELEMGFQFTGKGTIYVVQTEAEAAIKVTFKFKRGGGSAPGS